MNRSAIILFAHGARDPQWAEPFQQLAALVAAQRPDCEVRLAFLELMTPGLDDCVAALARDGIDHILITPVFMARGAHLRRDLPALVDALRSSHPQLTLTVTDAVGEAAPILAAMANWITQQSPLATNHPAR